MVLLVFLGTQHNLGEFPLYLAYGLPILLNLANPLRGPGEFATEETIDLTSSLAPPRAPRP